MSEVVIFVPGILGSTLLDKDGKRVWPANWSNKTAFEENMRSNEYYEAEPLWHYPATSLISLEIYENLRRYFVAVLGFDDRQETNDDIIDDQDRSFRWFAYDWRQSNSVNAHLFAQWLNKNFANTHHDITIIPHSMGGLVTRSCLEAQSHGLQTSVRQQIKRVAFLGTPHQGSPLLLANLLGINRSMPFHFFLNAKRQAALLRDATRTGALELGPRPGTGFVRQYFADRPDIVEVAMTDDALAHHFHPPVPSDAWENVEQFWGSLDREQEGLPAYMYFAASSKTTLDQIKLFGDEIIVQESRSSGDGTVSVLSALSGAEEWFIVTGKHEDLHESARFKAEMQRLFPPEGQPMQPVSAVNLDEAIRNQISEMALFVASDFTQSDEPFGVRVVFPEVQNALELEFTLAWIAPVDGREEDGGAEDTSVGRTEKKWSITVSNTRHRDVEHEVDLTDMKPWGVYNISVRLGTKTVERKFVLLGAPDDD